MGGGFRVFVVLGLRCCVASRRAQGSCNRKTGLCECNPGFEGEACDRISCPNSCSGHGVCRFVSELSTYDQYNWAARKIQGCRCDAGWQGIDCGRRICPMGDDPLTVPTSSDGQEWTITFQTSLALTAITDVTNFEFHLAITTLTGETVLTRPIQLAAAVDATGTGTGAKFSEALKLTEVIKTVTSTIAIDTAEDTVIYTFTLADPLRVRDIEVHWDDECTVAGCFPRRSAMTSGQITGATVAVVAPHANAESATCSNRGLCNEDTGVCTCFSGYYGAACERQTVLV